MKTITLVGDIETNGLLTTVTKFWVGVTYCLETRKYFSTRDVYEYIEHLNTATTTVFQNGVGYDLKALEILTGIYVTTPIVDTLLWSELAYLTLATRDKRLVTTGRLPKKLVGSHSLKAWGYRLGEHKGDYDDWSKYTPEMELYCKQDVIVTTKLYRKLLREHSKLLGTTLNLEQDVQKIITQQSYNGWRLDVDKAQKLHVQLLANMEPLEKEIHAIFLPKFLPKGKVRIPKKPFRRNGIWTMGPNQPIVLCTFNPNSSQHIAKWLIDDYGWRPYELTPKGSPKTGAEFIKDITHIGVKPLLDWLNNNKLLTMLATGKTSWLNTVTAEGRIHGSVRILGANTGRFTHSKP